MMMNELKKKGLELYREGMSLTSIEKEIGITRQTLSKYFKSLNIEIRNPSKKYHYNEDYFKEIDTENKAYWLGFIYADGCINNIKNSKSLEIILTHSDKQHLYKFIKDIDGSNEQVKDKNVNLKGKVYPSCRVVVSSTNMCDDLISNGVTSRKSLTKEFPKHLRKDLVRHFIRGYFDGNGCINTSGNRRRISITSNEQFLKSLINIFKELGVTPTKIIKDKRSKAKSYEKGGEGALKILSYIYSDSNIYLERKYAKANAVLRGNSQNDKCGIKRRSGKVIKMTRNTNRSVKRKRLVVK